MTYRQSMMSMQNSELFRQTKSVSPGRLHRQRQSFGPTLCLINNSGRNSKIEPNHQESLSVEKQQIFMLILEVERLNMQVAHLKSNNANNSGRDMNNIQTSSLHQQISILKTELRNVQTQRFSEVQKINRIIHKQTSKLSENQAQISIYKKRLQESQELILSYKRNIRDLEEEVGKARTQASRANFNALMNSQTDLQRSTIRDRGQLDKYKQKLSAYQIKLDQQKITLTQQREFIDKLKNNQLEMRQRFEYDSSNLRSENQKLKQKLLQFQKNSSEETTKFQENYRKQIHSKEIEIQKLQASKQNLTNQLHLLQIRINQIENSNRNSSMDLHVTVTKLQKQLEQQRNYKLEDQKKFDKYKNDNMALNRQNQLLRIQIKNLKSTMNSQIQSLTDQLQRKNENLRKIKKQAKNYQNNSRLNKSYSQTNIGISKKHHNVPQSDLKGIIADVIQLQNSNNRVARIIDHESRTKLHTATNVSRMVSYSSYGL